MTVHELDYKFPKDVLLQEYETLFDTKTEIQEPDSKRFSGFWLMWNTDVTKKIAQDFVEAYNIPYNYIVNFLYVEPNGFLPWHADQENSMCAMNCILTEDPVAIQFEQGEYFYNTALVDVTSLHQVKNNDKPRILFRITFQDQEATFDKVKEIICQK